MNDARARCLVSLEVLAAVACFAATDARAALEGYAWPLSAAPGDTVTFMVSSSANYQVTFARYQRSGSTHVPIPLATLGTQIAFVQPLPASPWEGCSWAPSFTWVIPPTWGSGIYAAELSGAGGPTFQITFIVKPPRESHADLATIANIDTWSAYNNWGGRSKYSEPTAHVLGFLRPNPAAAPSGNGVNHLARAELWVLEWLAANGYPVDVYSDLDFHRGVDRLERYKVLILNTHPEYWSREMMDRLLTYLDQGGSVLYMGGNGLYEEVQFSPDGKQLTFYPERFDGTRPARRYSYFSNLNPPRPERAVLGVAYRSDGFNTFAPFQVLQAGHRFFAGTGVSNGAAIGASGINGGGASGWEMDTSIPGLAANGVIVSASGSDDRGSPPANLELLARGTNAGGYGGDMTFYHHPGGGGVFAAGSLSFGGSLVVDPTLQRIVRNVLDEFLLSTIGVGPTLAHGPSGLVIDAIRPNPSAGRTKIRLRLATSEPVQVSIHDLAGRVVRTLVEGAREAGWLDLEWDGHDEQGRLVRPGLYLLRARGRDQLATARIARFE